MDELRRLVEIRLGQPEDFLKIKETLTRIGVASKNEKKLYQSCHILHKRGRYFIVHFKQMFELDGRPTDLDDEDIGRLNTIVSLLIEWKLLTAIDESRILQPRTPISKIKIISHRDKGEWELISKYTIGRRRSS